MDLPDSVNPSATQEDESEWLGGCHYVEWLMCSMQTQHTCLQTWLLAALMIYMVKNQASKKTSESILSLLNNEQKEIPLN